MAAKKITYGDVVRLLEVEGFTPRVQGTRVLFENASADASLILRSQKPTAAATGTQVQLVRRTLVDFGIMTESEFDRWIADPKHFQAA